MEKREPTLDQAPSSKDWGNLRFRPRAKSGGAGSGDDNAESRFWIGVLLFLAVALAFPWYSYWVNAFLLTRDLEAARAEFARSMEKAEEDMSRQLEAADQRARQQAAANAARREAVARQGRVARVQVVGAIPSRSGPIAIVRLERATLSEAIPAICRDAGAMLGRSLAGESLQVQRHRGNDPALTIGEIRCPTSAQ